MWRSICSFFVVKYLSGLLLYCCADLLFSKSFIDHQCRAVMSCRLIQIFMLLLKIYFHSRYQLCIQRATLPFLVINCHVTLCWFTCMPRRWAYTNRHIEVTEMDHGWNKQLRCSDESPTTHEAHPTSIELLDVCQSQHKLTESNFKKELSGKAWLESCSCDRAPVAEGIRDLVLS